MIAEKLPTKVLSHLGEFRPDSVRRRRLILHHQRLSDVARQYPDAKPDGSVHLCLRGSELGGVASARTLGD